MVFAGALLSPALAQAQRPVGVGDLARIKDVTDPQVSPDGHGWRTRYRWRTR